MSGTANTGIAALELDDRVDEFPSMALLVRGAYLRFLSASWNLNKVLGFRMTASLGIRLGVTNNDPRPRTKRSNEFRFGARRRERLLMSNCCFSTKDSATTVRTSPGRTSLAMVYNRWTASITR